MSKKIYFNIKYFIPALIWMLFIFFMSHTSGNDSANQSNIIATIIQKFINIDWELLTFIIRKFAHMCEFAILFLLLYYGFRKNNLPYHYALIITFIYACLDEFHQLFIPGRSGQFSDVLIDSSGALMALIIIWIYKKLR